jgi:hypothetical protein
MHKETLDLDLIIQPESLAVQISDKYRTWKLGRAQKEKASAEVIKYVFATDTRTTTNAQLPWKNSTTRPKLCQIRDNLHANYMLALFPNDNWFTWEAGDDEASTKEKKLAIEAYMRHILRDSKFKKVVSDLLYDWIDYGNCFADVIAMNEIKTNLDGSTTNIYIGPKTLRISPLDIVFDITAPSFAEAPSITRSILTLGQLHKLSRTSPDWKGATEAILAKIKDNRYQIANRGAGYEFDQHKASQYTADGFSSLTGYYASGSVEVLEFEGDLFDAQNNKLYENYRIVVLDRAYVVLNEPIVNYRGTRNKQHSGWRTRPDNVWAMGPLDNLVGLQYRIDHLENMKADIFDHIAWPTKPIRGYVEEFEDRPGERIYADVEADVEYLHPDTTALNADFQIQQLELAMEELAGAPKQAMGIRTPGEKTAFEVGALENASSRLFQNKASLFEDMLAELLNINLEVARRNLNDKVLVGTVSDDLGIQEFLSITAADLTAKGKLVPMGARHFAAQAQLVQNLVALSNTGMYQDPQVAAHLSSKAIAKILVEALNLDRYHVYAENVRITEQMETQQLMNQAQEELATNAITPIEDTEGAMIEEEDAPAQATY